MRRTIQPNRRSQFVAGLMAAGLATCLAATALAAPDAAAGKPLFSRYCIACHFPDGRPKMGGAPDLSNKAVQAKITDQRMISVILDGTPRMPGYKAQINPLAAANLAAYVRTLGK